MIQRIHHNLIRFGLTVSILVSLLLGLCSGAPAGEIFYPTGTYTSSATDLTVAARSIPMAWERSYRSNRVVKRPGVQFFDILPPDDGPLGYGWHSPWTVRLVTTLFKDAEENLRTQAVFIAADGRAYAFESDASGNFPPDTANGYELVAVTGGYEVRRRGANTFVFDGTGKLTAVRDPRNNGVTLTYNGSGELVAIIDIAGRTVYTFTWSAGHLSGPGCQGVDSTAHEKNSSSAL